MEGEPQSKREKKKENWMDAYLHITRTQGAARPHTASCATATSLMSALRGFKKAKPKRFASHGVSGVLGRMLRRGALICRRARDELRLDLTRYRAAFSLAAGKVGSGRRVRRRVAQAVARTVHMQPAWL